MKMQADLLVENAPHLVTLHPLPRATDPEGKLGVIPDGTLAAPDGRIVWVGPADQAVQHIALTPAGKELDASGKVVLPGFIDSHTHLIFAGTREKEFALRLQGASYQEISAKGGGIKSTVEKTRRASKEELIQAGKRNLDSMLSLGTTTVEAKTGYGLSTRDEIKMLDALAEKGVVATLLPGTAFFLFLDRYAPARQMISRGIPVALATDFNPGSCMTESLPLITTLACTQMRMTPAEAIQGIPLHAAGALRKEKVIASLEPGKQADLLLLGIPGYRRLSYHSGVNHVFKVIKKGRVAWEAESAHPRIRVDPR